MKKMMLCTDLDRTLLPNGTYLESTLARQRFNHYVSRDEVTLVYVSGRDRNLIGEAIEKYRIPIPDYIIGDVGSTIYEVSNNKWARLLKWEKSIQQDWKDKTNKDIQTFLDCISGISLQENEKQNHHKVSYYVKPYNKYELTIKMIEDKLESLGINSNIIWSIDDLEDVGLIDILPASASKKHAINFLMQELDFTLDETIFAGDSGNDISVISSPIRSILVANASQDVKNSAIDIANMNKQLDSLYIAKGNFMGMNGNYSAGILEGAVYFLPKTKEWIVNDKSI